MMHCACKTFIVLFGSFFFFLIAVLSKLLPPVSHTTPPVKIVFLSFRFHFPEGSNVKIVELEHYIHYFTPNGVSGILTCAWCL